MGDWEIPSLCWVRSASEQGCPGCGITRSVVAFFHGRWMAAFDLHPGGIVLALLALAQIPYRARRLFMGSAAGEAEGVAALGRSAVALVVVMSLARWIWRALNGVV